VLLVLVIVPAAVFVAAGSGRTASPTPSRIVRFAREALTSLGHPVERCRPTGRETVTCVVRGGAVWTLTINGRNWTAQSGGNGAYGNTISVTEAEG
jgi:hypothetical protein